MGFDGLNEAVRGRSGTRASVDTSRLFFFFFCVDGHTWEAKMSVYLRRDALHSRHSKEAHADPVEDGSRRSFPSVPLCDGRGPVGDEEGRSSAAPCDERADDEDDHGEELSRRGRRRISKAPLDATKGKRAHVEQTDRERETRRVLNSKHEETGEGCCRMHRDQREGRRREERGENRTDQRG